MQRESKVIRLLSIIHSGIILYLVCGFGGSVGEDVGTKFSFRWGGKPLILSGRSPHENGSIGLGFPRGAWTPLATHWSWQGVDKGR